MPRKALLPIGIRQTLFRAFALTSFKKGYSVNYAIRVARGLGISYMRKRMLADWREVTGLEKKKGVWKFIPKKFFPPEYLREKTDFAMKTHYHYLYDVEMKDLATGEIKTVKRTVATDELITLRQSEEDLKSLVISPIEDFYEDQFEVLRWEITGVRENIKWSE